MKLEEYKKMFGLDTEEKYRMWLRINKLGIYSCQKCDEIVWNPAYDKHDCPGEKKINMEFKPEKSDPKSGWEKYIADAKSNFDMLEQIDKAAKAEGSLLWRYIAEPIADGHAYYQIVRVNKKTVRIVHCTGLGDDWVVPYWGYEATIDIDYAQQKVSWRDKMDELFSK